MNLVHMTRCHRSHRSSCRTQMGVTLSNYFIPVWLHESLKNGGRAAAADRRNFQADTKIFNLFLLAPTET